MLRAFILLGLWHCGWTFKPPCTDDAHCDLNYYCDTSAYQCLDCLRCEDFRRDAPPTSTECVKSVVECGPCIEGQGADSIDCLKKVQNSNDNIIRENHSPDIQVPVFAWALIAIIVAVILAVVIMLQSNIVNKMTTYSLVCRTARQRSASGGESPASAPEPPPAYQAVCQEDSSALLLDTVQLEHESAMYIKPVVATPPEECRESSDRQAAVPYNHPAYVRSAPMSSSNLPLTNGAATVGVGIPQDSSGAVPTNGPVGTDVSVVDGLSRAVDSVAHDIPQHTNATNNTTDIVTGNDSGHSGYSNTCSEHNGSQVIVVNNIVNVQTASISEMSCSS